MDTNGRKFGFNTLSLHAGQARKLGFGARIIKKSH